MNVKEMGTYERSSFLRHLKDGFYLWDNCHNADGHLFAQEASVDGGEIWFVYYDKNGALYESKEFPVLDIDSVCTNDTCCIPLGKMVVREYLNKYGDIKTRLEWEAN